jgi:hypothetical protein
MPDPATSRLGALAALALTAGLAGGAALLGPADHHHHHPRPMPRVSVADGPRGMSDEDYLRFADRVVTRLEDSWSPSRHVYISGTRSVDTIYDAALLTVFATAAAHGHVGPARNDARARSLVAALLHAPPYSTRRRPPYADRMFHTPGWTSNMRGHYVDMDKSIDPKVAEGLTAAWRARSVLQLPAAEARRIGHVVRAVASNAFFRYPSVRLNQVNWNAELYGDAYATTGDPTLLRRDYREHLHRFVSGVHRPWEAGGATNLGPSYRFVYQDNRPADHPRNLDSPEYANITLHALYEYPDALRAGMRPLPHADVRVLRAWLRRDLFGYWTHAGFLNWDTGWSYGRWMKGKTWAFAQQGLLAIGRTAGFGQGARYARWAKWELDAGLRLYEHLGPRPDLFGIGERGVASDRIFAARMAANAARAAGTGFGRIDAAEPPPFYAYDADIGRLAVSTPAYSTAILAVDRGIVPYGGQELARLYDADGDPLMGTGGHGPAALGVVVRDTSGRVVLASQRGLDRTHGRVPLVLTASPRGPVRRQRPLSGGPDAGPFRRLADAGVRRTSEAGVVSRYAFAPSHVDARWTVTRRCACAATLQFPTWGASARVERLGPQAFRLRSARGSYVVHLRGPVGRVTRVLHPRPQRSDPGAGPTLALLLPGHARRVGVRARIIPSADGGRAL